MDEKRLDKIKQKTDEVTKKVLNFLDKHYWWVYPAFFTLLYYITRGAVCNWRSNIWYTLDGHQYIEGCRIKSDTTWRQLHKVRKAKLRGEDVHKVMESMGIIEKYRY